MGHEKARPLANHEVRTPLNSILGFATLLAEPSVGSLNDQQRHHLANIDSAGRQLLELINESLDLAKLKAGHVAVELRDLSAQAAMESAAGQVLLNLLSNAIRHTPAGGQVTLSAAIQADVAVIQVSDSGQGIARQDLIHIFEEFYQARNHAPGGTGLGLTISRRLVEQMRGTIEVEGELGIGSTFTEAGTIVSRTAARPTARR